MLNSIVWTIGGSDSGGGAGIQADMKTFNAFGVHGCSVITALTAQNTLEVLSVEPSSSAMIQSQIDALDKDLRAKAIKTGMLYSVETIKQVAKFFASTTAFKICDPVMIATSGGSLVSSASIRESFIECLLPKVDLLTPNLPEAEALLGIKNSNQKQDESYIKDLAKNLRSLGAKAVLIKGGHAIGNFCNDYFEEDNYSAWISSRRIETTSTHGTGCTLSAAITALISLDYSLLDSIVIAKAYVNQGLRTAKTIGKGHGPIAHGNWPEHFDDLPILVPANPSGTNIAKCFDLKPFPDCGSDKLGVYPIVDNFSWLEKLLPLGISTIQLRIKKDDNDTKQQNIEQEIIKSIEIAKRFDCRLFINDYWQLAIKYGAYGVHLGQEDLSTADINALLESGIRLGISTHCYSEVARALAYKPSYIAIGPIFSTTSKSMPWVPHGIENFKRWRRSLPYPLVAIAGMNLERLPSVINAGANGVAVIRDILLAPNPIATTKEWLEVWEQNNDLSITTDQTILN